MSSLTYDVKTNRFSDDHMIVWTLTTPINQGDIDKKHLDARVVNLTVKKIFDSTGDVEFDVSNVQTVFDLLSIIYNYVHTDYTFDDFRGALEYRHENILAKLTNNIPVKPIDVMGKYIDYDCIDSSYSTGYVQCKPCLETKTLTIVKTKKMDKTYPRHSYNNTRIKYNLDKFFRQMRGYSEERNTSRVYYYYIDYDNDTYNIMFNGPTIEVTEMFLKIDKIVNCEIARDVYLDQLANNTGIPFTRLVQEWENKFGRKFEENILMLEYFECVSKAKGIPVSRLAQEWDKNMVKKWNDILGNIDNEMYTFDEYYSVSSVKSKRYIYPRDFESGAEYVARQFFQKHKFTQEQESTNKPYTFSIYGDNGNIHVYMTGPYAKILKLSKQLENTIYKHKY